MQEPVGVCTIKIPTSLCCTKQLKAVSARLKQAETRFLARHKRSVFHVPVSLLDSVYREDGNHVLVYKLSLDKLGWTK